MKSNGPFSKKKFNVENSLNLVSDDYCVLPASHIYNAEALAPYASIIRNCHIYLIGFTPKIELQNVTLESSVVNLHYKVGSLSHTVFTPVPQDWLLEYDDEQWFCVDQSGARYGPNNETRSLALSRSYGGLPFEVEYVGQAYGNEGSRNALDRLVSHSTLQKISLKGVPKNHIIQIIMVGLMPNRLITFFSPNAKQTESGEQRIKSGLDKLYGTSEKERITLYEASLIRYFQPENNIEFKNSFPSTNMKVLEDCYKKDFNSIVSEFNLENFIYNLYSEKVAEKANHIAHFELHNESDRQIFFFNRDI